MSQNDLRIQQRIEKLGQFRRWLTHEVLPAIRKHGAYAADSVLEQVREDPEELFKIAERLVAEKENRRSAEPLKTLPAAGRI